MRVADLEWVADADAAETPLFVGIGPADQVARYLDGVGLDERDDIDVDPFAVTYNTRPGA